VKQNNEWLYRWALILVCILVFGLSFAYMNKYYDPLARYPYVTDENREVILEHLDSDEIDYLISQKIEPEQFLPFIDEEGFELKNTLYYSAALQARKADLSSVVSFVNKYRDYFSLSSLPEYLKNYSYEDLISFIETVQVLHEDVSLAQDPSAADLILSKEMSVYKYVPENLSSSSAILLNEEALQAMENMLADFDKTFSESDGSSLSAWYGYQSYEQILENYIQALSLFGNYTDLIYLDGGLNETQLGYTLTLSDSQAYNEMLLEYPEALEEFDYSQMIKNMDAQTKEKIEWLENNAWRYGFIIRYPKGLEEKTGHVWQPFVLRYVGEQAAKEIHDRNISIEQYME
jgi:D-alanyl-D-alanine carboxypeptidase